MVCVGSGASELTTAGLSPALFQHRHNSGSVKNPEFGPTGGEQ
jgi:hypothetical protein